jgi:hypothetical protein
MFERLGDEESSLWRFHNDCRQVAFLFLVFPLTGRSRSWERTTCPLPVEENDPAKVAERRHCDVARQRGEPRPPSARQPSGLGTRSARPLEPGQQRRSTGGLRTISEKMARFTRILLTQTSHARQ